MREIVWGIGYCIYNPIIYIYIPSICGCLCLSKIDVYNKTNVMRNWRVDRIVMGKCL